MDQLKRMGTMGHSELRRDVGATEGARDMPNRLILAVETSSRIGSVALALGPDLLAESSFSAPLRHSMEILPAITQLLHRFGRQPEDIRQIHIATGPGSFTGLRIAVAMAKAMSLAGGVEIITVDTLDTIAANVAGRAGPSTPVERLAVILDAKRGQFFAAVYDRIDAFDPTASGGSTEDPGYQIPAADSGFWRKVVPDCLVDAPELLRRSAAAERPVYIVGDGLLYHHEAFESVGIRVLDEGLWSPRASRVHTLGFQKARAGRVADPLTVVPFYLRGPDVTVKKV